MIGDRPALRVDVFVGSDERWVAAPDRALSLQHVRWDLRGGWERSGGFDQMLQDSQGGSPFAGQGVVQSIHWFSEHNGGPQWLLYELGERLAYHNGSANNFTSVKTNRYTTSAPWQHTQYAASGNSCWIVNGHNEPIRFHFGVAYKAGFDGPAPPVIVDGYVDGFTWGTSYAGLGLGDPGIGDGTFSDGEAGGGEYAYLLTEGNEFGTMSPPSSVYASVKWQLDPADLSRNDVNAKYFTRVRIPSPSGDHVMRRYLWRTKNLRGLGVQDGVRFYLCAVLQGAGSFPHVDALPDQYLGQELDFGGVGVMPRDAKLMCIWKGHAWYAGMVSDPDAVYRSEPLDYENVPAQNRYPVGNADSGEVMAMRATNNCLVVYRRRGVFLIMESDAEVGRFTEKTVTLTTGCCAPNTVQDVPGLGQFFASDDGVYLYQGGYQEGSAQVELARMSEPLADFWRWRVNQSAMANAWAAVNHTDSEYWLSVPLGGNPSNAMVFVYSWVTRSWTFRPGMAAACMVETNDHRRQFYIGSNDDADRPGVMVYTPWYTTLAGDAYVTQLVSSWVDVTGGAYSHFSPTALQVRTLGYGDPTLSLTYYKDRRSTALTTPSQSVGLYDPEYAQAKPDRWGSALWSTTATWGQVAPTTLRYDLGSAAGKMKELKYTLVASGRVQLLGTQVSSTVAPQDKTVNAKLGTGTSE